MDFVGYLNPFQSPSAASQPPPPPPPTAGSAADNDYESALKAYQQRLNRVKKEPAVPTTPSAPPRGDLSPKDTIPPASIERTNTKTSPPLTTAASATTPLTGGGRLEGAFSPSYSPMATPAPAVPPTPQSLPTAAPTGVDTFVLERRVAELERVNQRLVQDAADEVRTVQHSMRGLIASTLVLSETGAFTPTTATILLPLPPTPQRVAAERRAADLTTQLTDAARKAGEQAAQLQRASDDLAEARRVGMEKDRTISELTSKAGTGDSAAAAMRREAEEQRKELDAVRLERDDLRVALQVRPIYTLTRPLCSPYLAPI